MTQDSLPEDPVVGTVLGESYRLERKIGEGGMATVYEAAHTRIERNFAIKILKVNSEDYPQLRQRFEREARIGSQLGHDHIVQVMDFNQTPRGQPYLVMELLQGDDLGNLLKRERGVPMEWAVSVLRQVGSALSAAHEHDVVHRDLKPENIFLCGDGKQRVVAKVLDFGISKILTSESKVTKDSAVFGTPWYMSPEQALGKVKEIQQPTDIFAMGVILYHMLSGKVPFDGSNAPTVLYKIVHEEPVPLAARRPDLPPALVHVVERAMSKPPPDRYPSMAQMVVDMEAALGPRLSWARAWGQAETDREVEVRWEAPEVRPAPDYGQGKQDTAHLPGRVTRDDSVASKPTVLSTEADAKKATTTFKIEHLDRGRRWVALMAGLAVLGLGGGAALYWASGSDGRETPAGVAKLPAEAAVKPARPAPVAPAVSADQSVVAAPAPDITSTRPDAGHRLLSVTSRPSGARIKIGGTPVGSTPIRRLPVARTALVLVASKAGHAPATRRLDPGAEARTLQLSLTALAASLTVVGLHKGNPVAADVYINGSKRDQTPARIKGLKPGKYTLQLRGKGFQSRTRKLNLRPGEQRREVIELRR